MLLVYIKENNINLCFGVTLNHAVHFHVRGIKFELNLIFVVLEDLIVIALTEIPKGSLSMLSLL